MKRIIGLLVLLLASALPRAQEDYARQDALIFQTYYYPPLDTLSMAQFWSQVSMHSEAMYNGDGSWGLGYADWPTQPYPSDHPLVRVVARHALGLLALKEAGLADSVMVYRIRAALNWLLERQTREGAWPVYTNRRSRVTSQSVYPTALALQALSRGYRLLDNPRYLLAATRAQRWLAVRPEDDSPLNQALVLVALLEHYRTVHRQDLLERALKAGVRIVERQRPDGGWQDPGPLSTAENAIIAEALLLLEGVLVETQPFRRRLRGAATAAMNFLLARQLEDGNFAPEQWEPAVYKVPTYEIMALIQARRARGIPEFDLPITGAVRALNTHESNLEGRWRSNQDGRFLAMAEVLVWFVTTQNASTPEEKSQVPVDSAYGKSILPGSPNDR